MWFRVTEVTAGVAEEISVTLNCMHKRVCMNMTPRLLMTYFLFLLVLVPVSSGTYRFGVRRSGTTTPPDYTRPTSYGK